MPLGEIADVKGGITLNKAREVEDPVEVPYLRVANVQRGHLDLSEIKRVVIEKKRLDDYMLQPGDILFNEGGDRDKLGRGWVWNGEIPGCCHQNHVFRARPDTDRVDSKFVSYWANEFGRAYFEREGKQTTNLASINRAKLCALPIPLPPLPEQRRIVARIEELFSRLDAGVAALRHAKAQLQRYRQSVLAAAVTGQLTQAWREQHPDTEPANELLERILQTRRKQWQGTGSYKEPKSHSSTKVSELPRTWRWIGMRQAGETQLGRQLAPQHYSGDHMRPYLRVANVFEDRLDLSDVKTMNFTPAEFDRYKLEHGDVLLAEGQTPDLVGRPAMFRGEIENCCYQKTLHRFRAHKGVLPKYALTVFRAYMHNGRFKASSSITTNIAHLTQRNFIEIEFPLPPLAEQYQIVAEVEARTTVIDHLKAELDRQITRSSCLRQATLSEAFCGKL